MGSDCRKQSYPGTDVFVVCFSVVRPETLVSLQEHWIPEIHMLMGDTPFIVVGTHADMRDDPDVIRDLQARGRTPVRQRDGAAFCRKLGALGYFEFSPDMKKRVRKVMNETLEAVFSPKHDQMNVGCCVQWPVWYYTTVTMPKHGHTYLFLQTYASDMYCTKDKPFNVEEMKPLDVLSLVFSRLVWEFSIPTRCHININEYRDIYIVL